MTQVEICLHAVYSYVTLPMLIRVEGARIDIDIRVKLLNGNIIAPRLEQLTD